MTDSTFLTVKKVISDLLNKPELMETITREVHLRGDLAIDSLLTMDLVLMLEDELSIMIPADRLTSENLTTVGGVCRMISGIKTP
ncbi:MAG: acyl carrier protein [Proteobacteria bacterium]|nr:acyl carrier protein [Pseudomonadota bacterium]